MFQKTMTLLAGIAILATAACCASREYAPETNRYAFRPATYRPQVEVASAHVESSPARSVRTDLPAPRPAAKSPAPARRPVAPPGGPYVRLRGSKEIHVPSCPKVLHAAAGGVVEAHWGEGPPCFMCMKSQALAWSR